MSQGSAIKINCVAVGDAGVGKTALIQAYLNTLEIKTPETTFDNFVVNTKYGEENIILSLSDGSDEKSITSDVDIFVLVFSVVSTVSLDNVKNTWLSKLKGVAPATPILLVGTQIDLSNDQEFLNSNKSTTVITTSLGKATAVQLGVGQYYEASATTKEGIDELFAAVVEVGFRHKTQSNDGVLPALNLPENDPQRFRGNTRRKSVAKRLSVANMNLSRQISDEHGGGSKKHRQQMWITSVEHYLDKVNSYPPSYDTAAQFLVDTFFYMCQTGPCRVMKWFVSEYNARLEFNQKRHFGMSCVHLAAFYGQFEIVRVFLDHKMAADGEDEFYSELRVVDEQKMFVEGTKRTPLLCAAMCNDIPVAVLTVKVLLENKVGIDRCDSNGLNALHRSSYLGHKEVVAVLIDNSAKINARDTHKRTSLMYASARGHSQLVTQLLVGKEDNKGDIHAQDSMGMTALHWAAQNDKDETVRLLIASKANAGVTDKQGRTALSVANQHNSFSAVQTLTEIMAQHQIPVSWGITQGNLARHHNEKNKITCIRVVVPVPGTVGVAIGIRWKESEEWVEEKASLKVAVLGDLDGLPNMKNILAVGEGVVDPSHDQGKTRFYQINMLPLQVCTYWVSFITDSPTVIEKDSRLTDGFRVYMDNCDFKTALTDKCEQSKIASNWKKSPATFAMFISATDPASAKNSAKTLERAKHQAQTAFESQSRELSVAALARDSSAVVTTGKKRSIIGMLSGKDITDSAKIKVEGPVSSNVLVEGLLQKKGKGLISKYSSRYFVLTDTSLDYYKTEALYSSYKMPITAGRSSVVGAKVALQKDPKGKHPYKFIWTNPGEKVKHEVAVADQATLDKWTVAFKKLKILSAPAPPPMP